MNKDDAVAAVIELLRHRFGNSIDVVGHWDADRTAVGVARRDSAQPLVYIRALQSAGEQRFYVALESPPICASELPYTPAGDYDDVSQAEVVALVGSHLNLNG